MCLLFEMRTDVPFLNGGCSCSENPEHVIIRLQRFITQDTYKGSIWQPGSRNLYTYVGNNPVNYVDPTGHDAQAIRNLAAQYGGSVSWSGDTGTATVTIGGQQRSWNINDCRAGNGCSVSDDHIFVDDGSFKDAFGFGFVHGVKRFASNVVGEVKAAAMRANLNVTMSLTSTYIAAKALSIANDQAGVPSDVSTTAINTAGDVGLAVVQPDTSSVSTAALTVLTGFTGHGLNQTISRDGHGVANWAILDTLHNPVKTVPQTRGATKYIGQSAVVVLNEAKKVITTFAKSHTAWRH